MNEIMNKMKNVLENSTITSMMTLKYVAGINDYQLDGFKPDNQRIIEILSVSGIGIDGNYTTLEDLTEGTDWDMYDGYTSPEIIGEGYGTSTNKQVYNGITFHTLVFKDSTDIHIIYTWHNPNFKPVLTNNSSNSFINLILASIITNQQLVLSSFNKAVENFGINQGGEDLDRLATIVGLTREQAEYTTGKIKIINNSGSQLNLSSDARFVSASGDGYTQFKLLSGSASISDGNYSFVSVIAIEPGNSSNIGSLSIIGGFYDNNLSLPIEDSIIITNPSVDENGDLNLFNNGKNEETDNSLRARIQLAFQTVTSSSYSAIERNVLSTDIVKHASVYDISSRKGIPSGIIHVYVSPMGNSLFSPTDLSLIHEKATEVSPVGTDIVVIPSMTVYMIVNMTLYVNKAVYNDHIDTETKIINILKNQINEKKIGEDIIPSTLLALVRSSIDVLDATIDKITVSEYTSEVNTSDTVVLFDDSLTPTTRNEIAVQIFFNSVVKKEDTVYTTVPTYITSENPIDNRIAPTVKKRVTDYREKSRESPLDRTDFYQSSNDTSITYDNTNLTNPTDLIVNYNLFDDVTIDGIKLKLKGEQNNIVNVEIREGVDIDTATLVAGSQTAILLDDPNGNEKLYSADFSSTLTLAPSNKTYWLVISHSSGTGKTEMMVDKTNQMVVFNPMFYVDGYEEDTPGNIDGTWERKYYRGVYETFHMYTGAKAYSKIPVADKSYHPEIVRLQTVNLSFELYVDE